MVDALERGVEAAVVVGRKSSCFCLSLDRPVTGPVTCWNEVQRELEGFPGCPLSRDPTWNVLLLDCSV